MKTRHCIVFFTKKCYYCSKKHRLGQKYIYVDVCTMRKKSWWYYCNSYKKESMDTVCVDCIEEKERDATIDKDLPRPSLSPITTKCDNLLAPEVCSLVPPLLDLEFDSNLSVNHWKNLITINFTHLHPEKHKFPNQIQSNSKPVDSMFLLSHSLYQLLEDDSKIRVTEELYNVFVDVLNFHGEYLPSK